MQTRPLSNKFDLLLHKFLSFPFVDPSTDTMVAASLTKTAIGAPMMAQAPARAARAAALPKPVRKVGLFTKSDRTLSVAVAGRIATVQVGWVMSTNSISHLALILRDDEST